MRLTLQVLEYLASQMRLAASSPLILVTLAQGFRSLKEAVLISSSGELASLKGLSQGHFNHLSLTFHQINLNNIFWVVIKRSSPST